jgi:hypothetical protein
MDAQAKEHDDVNNVEKEDESTEDELLLIEKDGMSMRSSTLRILDLTAYFGSWIPFAILLGFASLNPRAACWTAFSCCTVLLSIDYLRVRFAKFQPMRIPDVISSWSFVALLALGIVAETKLTTFNRLYYGPVLVSVLLFGVLLSYLFREAYPLHTVDR